MQSAMKSCTLQLAGKTATKGASRRASPAVGRKAVSVVAASNSGTCTFVLKRPSGSVSTVYDIHSIRHTCKLHLLLWYAQILVEVYQDTITIRDARPGSHESTGTSAHTTIVTWQLSLYLPEEMQTPDWSLCLWSSKCKVERKCNGTHAGTVVGNFSRRDPLLRSPRVLAHAICALRRHTR
eukprot:624375-Pyramimonas_sp.AAC.1